MVLHRTIECTAFTGKVTPVDFDPRFALVTRIESVNPAAGSFTAGTVVAFAIHSPALLFGGDSPKGITYDFSLQREIEHGKTRFFGLEVDHAKTAPTKSIPPSTSRLVELPDVFQGSDSGRYFLTISIS
jgi:hypothetical protein